MPRIVKEEEYAIRRNEILQVAQRLVYTKGYEQMAIQDILNELGISKGAFYHYFDSKPALLEALIERMSDEGEQVIAPILQDPALPALEKLQRYFDTAIRWKTAQKAYILALMRTWYADENAIVREKAELYLLERFAPAMSQVVCQGVEEGVFQTPFPDQMGMILLKMITAVGDVMGRRLSEPAQPTQTAALQNLEALERLVVAHNDALERLLGAPQGSISIIDLETLREWMLPPL
jgi:AcrR family transcriptional regulator